MKWSVRDDSPDLFADDHEDDATVETETLDTGFSSSQLSDEKPASQRRMIDLEAPSAMVSRYRLSNAAAAAVLTAGYEDKDGRVRAHHHWPPQSLLCMPEVWQPEDKCKAGHCH